MLQERTQSRYLIAECKAALALAPAIMALALVALMGLFLGAGGGDLAALNTLLTAWSIIASLWLASIMLRARRDCRAVLRRLPAWLWVAGWGLLALAILAALSLVIAARLTPSANLTAPAFATAALVLAVFVFWIAYGFTQPGPGASRFSGPGTER